MKPMHAAVPFGFLVLAIPGLVAALEDDPATTPGTSVAVVDVVRVLREAAPLRQADLELKEWVERERAPLEQAKQEIDRLEAELEVFDRASPEYLERAFELDRKKLAFDHEYRVRDRGRVQRIVDTRRASFERVRQAAAEAARQRGIGIVLQVRSEPPAAESEAELFSEILLRSVLVHDPALDITSDVISILDR
jgi:Skp family chaperone for outer membrane proteins